MASETAFWQPGNRRLLIAACAVQLALIALPFVKDIALPAIVVMVLFSIIALFGSPTTAVLYLCFTAVVVPSWFYDDYLPLPFGFKFYEGLFLLVIGLAALTWLLDGRWHWRRRTRLDLPVTVFLGLVILSIIVAQIYGQSTSEMLRSVRFPLYYALFWVVTWFFDSRRVSAFLSVVLASAAILGIQYLAEFFSMVNLSVSGAFYRIARLEGVMLPIGILMAVATMIYGGKIHQRVAGLLALVPCGLAFMLTVGRGFWIALFAGLGALGGLVLMDRQFREARKHRLFILMAIPLVLLSLLFIFQSQTRTSVGEVAVQRFSSAAKYEEDLSIIGRLLAYDAALKRIRQHPLLGGGHGETVTFPVTDISPPTVVTLGAVDNVYLTIGMRMGLIGIASFLWMYGMGLWIAYRLFQRSKNAQTRVFCAAFISVYSMMLVYGAADATLMVNRLIFIHATFLGILGQLDGEERTCAG